MFVSIYKVWAKLFTFLSIKICSVAYGGILLPDILDYFLILTTRGGKYSVSSASRDRVIIRVSRIKSDTRISLRVHKIQYTRT